MSEDAGSLDTRTLGLAPPLAGQSSRRKVLEVLGLAWRIAKDLIKTPFYVVYRHRLEALAHTWRRPRHIGVIMDGNRRFARSQGLFDALQGHERGAQKLHELLEWCYEADIPVVTVWCFSLENFQRSAEEVQGLLRLFEDKTREMADGDEVHRRRVRVRYIGKLELLPDSLRAEIRRVEATTAGYDQFELNIAMAYGGREEIADAFRSYVRDRLSNGMPVEEALEQLEAASIEPYLYTKGQPEPDLILRTSGEIRLSGFLLWQSAHSEFYFCETTWPAFRKIDFLRALRAYDMRQRRFGR